MLWDIQLHELRRYQEEYERLDVPFKWHDATGDFNNHLSIWYHAQPHMFRLRRLSPNQARAIGAPKWGRHHGVQRHTSVPLE